VAWRRRLSCDGDSGRRGVFFVGSLTRRDGNPALRAELYIDVGDRDENKALFGHLYAQRGTVEGRTGEPLMWDRLDERKACRISRYRPSEATVRDRGVWPELNPWLVQAPGTMRRAPGPHL